MKNLLTIASLGISFSALAQPIINNASNLPAVGYTDTVSVAVSAMSPGAGGANATWNFSSLNPTAGGTFELVNPSATPYAANFSTATHAIKLTPFSGTAVYEYWKASSAELEILGSNISSGSGTDYTPNPKTLIPFPYSYGTVHNDVFQTTSGGPYNLTVTYDGYGTLITPFTTHTNVVRSKRDFGGSDYYYEWYITSPILMTVASFDNNTGKYTFLGKSIINSVDEFGAVNSKAIVSPNPVQQNASIKISGTHAPALGTVHITDISGRWLQQLTLSNGAATFCRDQMPAGVYIYSVYDEKKQLVAKGEFLVQ